MKILPLRTTSDARNRVFVAKMTAIVDKIAALQPGREVSAEDLAEYVTRHPDEAIPAEVVIFMLMGWSSLLGEPLPATIAESLAKEIHGLLRGVRTGTVRELIAEVEKTEALCPHCNGPIDFAGIREMLVARQGPKNDNGKERS